MVPGTSTETSNFRMQALANAIIDARSEGVDMDEGHINKGSSGEPDMYARPCPPQEEFASHSDGKQSTAPGVPDDEEMSDALLFNASQIATGDLRLDATSTMAGRREVECKTVEDATERDTDEAMDEVSAHQSMLELQPMSPVLSKGDARQRQLPGKGKSKAVTKNPGAKVHNDTIGIQTRSRKEQVRYAC